ncbi:MAG: MarR family transcriptional regulator [Candidatus Hodarchaeota archaeon]
MKDEEDRVLSALRAAGRDGLLIKELATSLGVDSTAIAKTIRRLTSEGLVELQDAEMKEERYVVRQAILDDSEAGSLSDMDGCPCFHCLRIGRCGIRQPDSPVTCRDLEEWMISTESS